MSTPLPNPNKQTNKQTNNRKRKAYNTNKNLFKTRDLNGATRDHYSNSSQSSSFPAKLLTDDKPTRYKTTSIQTCPMTRKKKFLQRKSAKQRMPFIYYFSTHTTLSAFYIDNLTDK